MLYFSTNPIWKSSMHHFTKLTLVGCFLLLFNAGAVVLHAQDAAVETPAEEKPAADPETPPGATAEEDPAHDELRALREGVKEAVNGNNLDDLLTFIHPDVVVVWHNAVISRKHQGVKDYYAEVLGGEDAILSSFTIDPEVKELTILHGDDTGVVYGTVVCHYAMKDGRTFDIEGPWNATLVKTGDGWKIAAFHASVGLFNNPLAAAAQSALIWGCVICGGIGLLIGFVAAWLLKRPKAA